MQLSEAVDIVSKLAKHWIAGSPHQNHPGLAMQVVADAATIALSRMGDIEATELHEAAQKAHEHIVAQKAEQRRSDDSTAIEALRQEQANETTQEPVADPEKPSPIENGGAGDAGGTLGASGNASGTPNTEGTGSGSND